MKLEEKAMPEQDKQKRRMSYAMRDSLSLTLLAVPGIVLLFIFNYLPVYGLSVAFKQFNPNFGIWKSPWVGWDNFEFFFTSQDAWRVLRNTVLYSLDFMFVGLVFAVLVALLLYNMRSQVGVKVYNTEQPAAEQNSAAGCLIYIFYYKRATPVSFAACATALATASFTTGLKLSGMMYSGESSFSGIAPAMALAAAIFMASLMSLARTSKAPRKIPGNAKTLLI